MNYELAEAEQQGQIVITLQEGDARDLCVQCVDVFATPMKIRLSSPENGTVQTVFHREIADLMRRICDSAPRARQIITVPDFSLRFRGLIVRGYTLVVQTLGNGLRQFVLRLQKGMGNALALFKSCDVFGGPLTVAPAASTPTVNAQRLFDDMLAHIYLPLVNLNSFLGHVLDSRSEVRRHELLESVVHLKTKAEMLQFAFDRVVSEVMIEKYAVNDQSSPMENRAPLDDITPAAHPG